jgi:hypothetical protein
VLSDLRRAAIAAVLLLVLASACSPDGSPSTVPEPLPSRAATGAGGDETAEVERRLSRLKAELAVTPHFCSLENRPCRTDKRALIERGIDALLARCRGRARREFDRCLDSERAAVLAGIASPPPPS